VAASHPFFDLACLTKPLVTAPLALKHLALDMDRRKQLGFTDRPGPLTVRQLLSHSSGLPAWLPYTGEPLAQQLRRGVPEGQHPLFRMGRPGLAVYSDLGYRLLAELLEMETGRPFLDLASEATGLLPAPWLLSAQDLPDGPDTQAWGIAEPTLPLPPRRPDLPQDANARAGMQGHSGFGGTPELLKTWLSKWIDGRFPSRMACETARAADGTVWGLGLQRTFRRPLAFWPPPVPNPHRRPGHPGHVFHRRQPARAAARPGPRPRETHGLLDALRPHGTSNLCYDRKTALAFASSSTDEIRKGNCWTRTPYEPAAGAPCRPSWRFGS
jgi:hypothetical protein